MSVSAETAARIVTLIEEGRSTRSVAREFNLTLSSVQNIFNRYVATGSYHHLPRSGRPRVTSLREDGIITRKVQKDPFLTSSAVAADLNTTRETPVSSRTVRRRFKQIGLHSRRSAKNPALTRKHQKDRLQFAKTHVSWTPQDWVRVLFTDESRFKLRGPDGRQRVWRKKNTRYNQQNRVQCSQHWGASIMVWGGINSDARTDLHLCTRTVNTDVYIEKILLDHVVPFAGAFEEGEFLFQQDNARPHVSKQTMTFFQEVGITPMKWPACSPDLNPIEHVWDWLGRGLCALPTPPTSIAKLGEVLIRLWKEILQEKLRSLIDSMPRRCQAVIDARGGPTKY